jgi:hypothetical protein
MKQSALVLAALILAMQGETRAQQFVSGNELLGYCTDANKLPSVEPTLLAPGTRSRTLNKLVGCRSEGGAVSPPPKA